MGDKKNLFNKDASLEIQKLAKEINSCMFCTYVADRLHSRPMSTREVDEEGNVWFLSDKRGKKNQEIAINNKVDLLYGQGHDKYLTLHGTAVISYDRAKIKELWTTIAKVWMPGGEEDPNLCVIKVTVHDGYYWDAKHGKMLEIAKMGAALLTGRTMDDGIEGQLITASA